MNTGQAWGFDIMIGVMLFLGGVLVLYFYAVNATPEGQEILDSMEYDGAFISDVMLSEGSPNDWTTANVISPGFLSGNFINETKLERFYELSISDYPRLKGLLQTRYDFYFNFSEPMFIQGNYVGGIGNPSSASTNNLIQVERVASYKNKPVTLTVQVWE